MCYYFAAEDFLNLWISKIWGFLKFELFVKVIFLILSYYLYIKQALVVLKLLLMWPKTVNIVDFIVLNSNNVLSKFDIVKWYHICYDFSKSLQFLLTNNRFKRFHWTDHFLMGAAYMLIFQDKWQMEYDKLIPRLKICLEN